MGAGLGRRSRRAGALVAVSALVLALALGVRQTFGLFLKPASMDLGLGREAFAFAFALQNLIWGLAQPVAGAVADRFGPARVIAVGGVLDGGGLAVMAGAADPLGLHLGGGVLVGLGLSATSFAVVLGAVGRAFAPERRSLALGITAAAGSFGQFALVPPAQAMISGLGWAGAALGLAAIAGLMVPLAAGFAGAAPGRPASPRDREASGLAKALAQAGRHGGFWLLSAGFFVCGFQVVFIAVHLPAFLSDRGLKLETAATALALIGLFNIAGTWLAGYFGGRHRKKHLLAFLYLARAAVIALFLALPWSALSAMVFAALLGLLWLGTVPLTIGLVAQIFSPTHMGALFGLVFLSHQMGSFLGAWAGGMLFDLTGGYEAAWAATVALGLVAAALHWPIRDDPLEA